MSEVSRQLAWNEEDRFEALVVNHLSNQLSAVESAEFWQILSDQPERCHELMTIVWQARLIRSWLAVSSESNVAGLPLENGQSDGTKTDSPTNVNTLGINNPLVCFVGRTVATLNRPAFWSIIAVAVAFYGTFTLISWNLRSEALPSGSDGKDSAVAMIASTTDAQWSPETAPKTNDSLIKPGEPLEIDSGIVDLQLTSGVTLLVEGPAQWSIDGGNQATLRAGRLIAKVPRKAIGFALETPTARIVDLGTEFGVEVSPNGEITVQVLQGKVNAIRLTANDAVPAPIKPLRIEAGQTMRIPAGDAPVAFVTPDQFDHGILRSRHSEGREQDPYARYVLADQPIAYWRLSDGLSEMAKDESGHNRHGTYAGAILPNQPGIPGVFGNQSIRVQGGGGEGWIKAERLPLGLSVTIELWAKSSSPTWNAHGWLSCARVANGFMVHPDAGGRSWRGYIFDATDNSRMGPIGSHTPSRIDDRFHYYVVSYDASTDTGRMYFDAEQVAVISPLLAEKKRLTSSEVTMMLGRDTSTEEGPRSGTGWIDEVAIYDYMLAPEAIQRHYEAGLAKKQREPQE